jgi:peptidoglycan/LPS O-acetylase OafA/YrhL
MKKFDAIEGLRGWLAWAVVFSHLVYMSGLKGDGLDPMLGMPRTLLFMIVSGFVITHLITEKPEPYLPYIVRRFARIFPLFAVTCFFGYFTNDLLANALTPDHQFADPAFSHLVTEISSSNRQHFWGQFLAHLTMLHGAIGNTVLPYSEYAFNMPAWSLSPEWQFYLIAPLVLIVVRRPSALIIFALLVAMVELLYKYWLSADFIQPGFLPAAAAYFAVGIASRMAYQTFSQRGYFAAICAVAIVILPLVGSQARPLLVWAVVFACLSLHGTTGESGYLTRSYRLVLTSPLATYFGAVLLDLSLPLPCNLRVRVALGQPVWQGA